MAITLSSILGFPNEAQTRLETPGRTFEGVAVLAGDASYPTGGYPFNAALFNLNSLQYAVPMCTNGGGTAPVIVVLDTVNSKFKLLVQTTGVEVANAVSEATLLIYVLVSGT